MRLTGIARKRLLILGALIGLVAAAFWLMLPPRPRPTIRQPPPAQAFAASAAVARGAWHVHTTRSDGSGTVDAVAAAAARAGLQFVIFTDHGDGRRAPDPPAYKSGVLCLDAVEISTDGGHYVALGLPQAPYRLAGEARDVVEDVARLGGFGVAAHPDSPKPELAWRDWQLRFDGLEWLNLDTEWRDESRARMALGLLQHLARPVEAVGALIGSQDGALRRWDALTSERRVVALAAVDAHARLGLESAFEAGEDTVFEVPSYETSFRTLQISAVLPQPLTGGAADDAAAVMGAVRAGHVFSVVPALAEPGDVRFEARSAGRTATMGDFLAPAGDLEVRAHAQGPTGARVRLVCDGAVVREAAAGQLLSQTWRGDAPGSCRLEAGWPAGASFTRWLVTNPIYFRAADPPPPPALSTEPRAFDTLGDRVRGARWVVEHDPRSRATVTSEGVGLAQRIALSYGLAEGDRAGQYAAVVTPDIEALATRTHLMFVARADRPMRLSVQVREPQPTGQGLRWRRSVFLDSTPRPVVLALDDLRPIPPASQTLSRPRLRSLLFVVDTEHTPTGASGTVWIEGVRACEL